VKFNSENFDHLVPDKNKNSLYDYNNVINKLLYQYHDIGRVCSLLTHHMRHIKEIIRKIIEFVRKLDENTTLYYNNINDILKNFKQKIKSIDNYRDELINKIGEQINNVHEYINLLDKKNSYDIFKYINSLNKKNNLYPDNIFTKPIPNIGKYTNLEKILTSVKPIEIEKFYGGIIPINKFKNLYYYNTTEPDTLDTSDTLDNKYIINNKFYNFSESNNIKTINKNTDNINDLYPLFYSIRNDYLNYKKHIYLQKIYREFNKNDEISIAKNSKIKLWDEINNSFLPLKDALNAPALYLKTIDNLLKENFKNVAYNTSLNIVNNAIKENNKSLILFEPREIKINTLLENKDSFLFDVGDGKNIIFNIDILENSSTINKKFKELKEKTQKLYEINKLNDNNSICIYNSNDMINLLCKYLKGKYNIRDNSGNTPLMYAINGLLTEIDYDKFNKNDIINIINNKGNRPLYQAIINMDNYFKIYYSDDIKNFLNNITDKYTNKYHSDLKSIPEFGNNILKSSTKSLNKFVILLMHYLYQSFNLMNDTPIDNTELYKFALSEAKISYNELKLMETKIINKINKYNTKIKNNKNNKNNKNYVNNFFLEKYINKKNKLESIKDKLDNLLQIKKKEKPEEIILLDKDIFGEKIIDIINKNNNEYSNSFNIYLEDITYKNDGLFFLNRLNNDYNNIVKKLKEEMDYVNLNKKLEIQKFTNLNNEIEKILKYYDFFEEIMKKYEKNPSLSKIKIVNDNYILKDITLLYHAILLSDITYNLKNSIISSLSQYYTNNTDS
jgi:hypothetical protein